MRETSSTVIQKRESRQSGLSELVEVERKRTALLSKELETSLRDELALRSRCSRLEVELHNATLLLEKQAKAISKLEDTVTELRESERELATDIQLVESQLVVLVQLLLPDGSHSRQSGDSNSGNHNGSNHHKSSSNTNTVGSTNDEPALDLRVKSILSLTKKAR